VRSLLCTRCFARTSAFLPGRNRQQARASLSTETESLLKQRNECLKLAEQAENEDIRDLPLNVAELCDRQAELLAIARQHVEDSKEAIAEARATLLPHE
jgi:hypothetical protein